MSIMLITHDLGVVAETCENVIVMYAGRIIEESSTRELFASPKHPYTAGLLRSMPGAQDVPPGGRLQEIPGMVPPLDALPTGCSFQERCSLVQAKCRELEPVLVEIGGAKVRCHYPLGQELHSPKVEAPHE